MLFKFQKIVGCIEPWVKNRDTNRIVSWCIVTALVNNKYHTSPPDSVIKQKFQYVLFMKLQSTQKWRISTGGCGSVRCGLVE